MDRYDRLDAALSALRRQGRLRQLRLTDSAQRPPSRDFSSNDYLALARDPRVRDGALAAIDAWGCGATGSRLLSGTLGVHAQAEATLADWLAFPACLIFGSGYLTNLGVVGALADARTIVFEDRLNHASLIDGARLSGARLVRYRHADVEHLRTLLLRHAGAARRLVVTDTCFSMDGDLAPLQAIAEVCAATDTLWVADEAHAIGIFGPRGRGCCAAAGVRPDVLVGTFSKALGSYGGFAACDARLRDCLVNRARSLIFTTGLAPACIGAALAALEIASAEPLAGTRLRQHAAHFQDQLRAHGLDPGPTRGPIVPLRIGDNHVALAISRALDAQGLTVPAIRPPTVPPGTARLRLSVTLHHTPAALTQTARTVAAAVAAVAAAQPVGRPL